MCILLHTTSSLSFLSPPPLLFYVTSPPPIVPSSSFLWPLPLRLCSGHMKKKIFPWKVGHGHIFDAFSLPDCLLFLYIFVLFCFFSHSTKFQYRSYFPCSQASQRNHRWLLFPVAGECTHYGWKKMGKRNRTCNQSRHQTLLNAARIIDLC